MARTKSYNLESKFTAMANWLKESGELSSYGLTEVDPLTLQVAQRNYNDFIKSDAGKPFRNATGALTAEEQEARAKEALAKVEKREAKLAESKRKAQEALEKARARREVPGTSDESEGAEEAAEASQDGSGDEDEAY